MVKFIVKRLLLLFPTMLAITFIIFGILSMTPGDPAKLMLDKNATPEAIKKLNHELGLDKPFVTRYINYVINLLKGDLGTSYRTRRSVGNEIFIRMPTTARLAIGAMLVAILIGIPLGVVAAVKQYSFLDYLGTTTALFMASMPSFWFGLLLILLFSLKLRLLPSNGSSSFRHYILPVLTLALGEAALLMRLTRATMLETIRQDYIRTARGKGQSEFKVITIHALRNALIPVITVIGLDFGGMLGGAVIAETIFSINGVGGLMLNAIRMKDVPQVMGCTIVFSTFFMLAVLLVDVLYAIIDPRIKALYQKG